MSQQKQITAGFLAAAFVLLAMMTLAGPARADTVFFGYRSGPWHGGSYHGHRHYRHRHRHYSHYAQSVVVVPPPTVVYRAPPPVYAPAPVYAPPPVTLVPASPIYQTTDGRYCREYQTVITVDGTARDSFGTACYAPDGTWRIVN
jgi:surface antigen